MKTALVFVTNTPPNLGADINNNNRSSILSKLAQFDNFSREDYDNWVKKNQNNNNSSDEDLHPVGYLEISGDSMSATCKIDPPVAGQYAILKLISGRKRTTGSSLDRGMQLNYVAFYGIPGTTHQYYSSKLMDLVLNPDPEIRRGK